MKRKNLENIKATFEKKTGVPLRRGRRYGPAALVLAAAAAVCLLSVTAYAVHSCLLDYVGPAAEVWPEDWADRAERYLENYIALCAEYGDAIVPAAEHGLGWKYEGVDPSGRPKASFTFHDTAMTIPEQAVRWNVLPDSFDVERGFLAGPEDKAYVISIFVPDRLNEGGIHAVPSLYVLVYDAQRAVPGNYAFLRGKLVDFEELEKCRIFCDEWYAAYDVTDYIYADREKYLEDYARDTQAVAWDDGSRQAYEAEYAYLRGKLAELFMYYDDYRVYADAEDPTFTEMYPCPY